MYTSVYADTLYTYINIYSFPAHLPEKKMLADSFNLAAVYTYEYVRVLICLETRRDTDDKFLHHHHRRRYDIWMGTYCLTILAFRLCENIFFP